MLLGFLVIGFLYIYMRFICKGVFCFFVKEIENKKVWFKTKTIKKYLERDNQGGKFLSLLLIYGIFWRFYLTFFLQILKFVKFV